MASDYKIVLSEAQLQRFKDATQRERDTLAKRYQQQLSKLGDNESRDIACAKKSVATLIRNLKKQCHEEGVKDGIEYSSTTWGFGYLTTDDIAELIKNEFDPSVTVKVHFSSSQDCHYIHVSISESQETKDLRARRAKEKKRKELLVQQAKVAKELADL